MPRGEQLRIAKVERTRERFNRHVEKLKPDELGCHRWLGATVCGVPKFRTVRPDGETRTSAARAVAVILNGDPFPAGSYTWPLCGNSWCVNPGHAAVGSGAQWGRWHALRGSKRSLGEPHQRRLAKLGWEQVDLLRARYAQGGITYEELGRQFGISKSQCSRIVRGEHWKEDDGRIK